MTKLYTAAEARRIDIERGGEGLIVEDYDHGMPVYYLDERQHVWCRKTSRVNEVATIGCNYFSTRCWLPLTPEPEQESDGELNLESLLRARCNDIEQLETRIETQARNVEHWMNKAEQLEKELAEANEKARWKDCPFEIPRDGVPIMYKGPRKSGFYSAQSNSWWINVNGGALKLDSEMVQVLRWKYEADL